MSGAKIKKGAGRPTVITPQIVAKLEHAFSIDCSVEEACFYAGISRDAFYDHCKKDLTFSDRMQELRQTPILLARTRVVKGVKESYSNAMDFLKRKRKKEFGDNLDVTTDGEKIESVSIIVQK